MVFSNSTNKFTFPYNALLKKEENLQKRDLRRKLISSPIKNRLKNRINNVIKALKGDKLEFANYEAVTPSEQPWLSLRYSDLSLLKSVEELVLEARNKVQSQGTPVESTSLLSSLSDAISDNLGIKYVFGGKSSEGIDCSGFTSKVFNLIGIDLNGSSINLWNQVLKIDVADLKYGDLLFLKGTIKGRKASLPSHVAIFEGFTEDGKLKVAEAAGGKSLRRTWDLSKGFYKRHWLGAGRIV